MKIYVRYFLIVLCLCVATSVHAEEICEIDRYNIIERVESRHYPSLLSQFGIGPWETTFSEAENRELYDLIFYDPGILLSYWRDTPDGMKLIADPGLESSKRRRERLLASNPNLVFLAVVKFYLIPDNYKEREAFNSIRDDFFLRDENGEIVRDEIWNSALLDFTLPQTQQYVKDQVMAISQCGLFDGIFLDNWSEHPRLYGYRTLEEEHIARDRILQSIREIDEDFLILVNSGPHKIPRWAPYINGIWMEAGAGANSIYDPHELDQIQETLLWAETEAPFREPIINALTADGNPGIPPDSSETLQVVRSLTTLVLTHSNAYMAFKNGGGFSAAFWGKDVTYEGVHAVWLDFWSASLGRPVGGDETKGQLYVNRAGEKIDGLFIREYTNGWAVYNRSGKAQSIQLPEMATGVTSGMRKRQHALSDLDGEIYLKTVAQVVPGKYPPLYWIGAKTDTLHSLVDNEVENLVPGIQNATSLAVDAAAGKLYWTEKTGNRTGKIQGANLDGTNLQLVKDLTSAPLDIALDTVSGKLYLSNTWGKIQRMNLDGSNFQPNLITGLKTPQHLVLDTTNSKLYWTEQTGKTTGKIQHANLDGSNVRLVKALTSAPRGMALDAVNRKLYLTNAWGKIQRMNLDGSSFQPNFITGLESPGQVAVDVVGSKVYWTEKGKLRRADLDGGNVQDVVTGLGELTDIALGIDAAGQTSVAAAPMTQTVVEQTSLLANYPNPFNPETWIPYHLANDTDVKIHIYDTRGSLVRRLELGHQQEGYYTSRSRAAYWDGRNEMGERVASGIYFYQLKAEGLSYLRKMVILK